MASTPRAPSQSHSQRISSDIDLDTDDPVRPHGSSFTLQMIMELKGTQGGLTEAVNGLTRSVDGHGIKLECISDLRADLREISTKLTALDKTVGETKTKVERVHNWIIGAAAIVGFLIVVGQIALRLLPYSSPALPPITVNIPPQTTIQVPVAPTAQPTTPAPAQK